MTGFGIAHIEDSCMMVNVEVRSVNHRNLALRLQIPPRYAAFEVELQRYLTQRLIRGQVSFGLSVTFKDVENVRRRFNVELLQAYLHELRPLLQLQEYADVWKGVGSVLLRFPEATMPSSPDESAIRNEWNIIFPVIERALDELEHFRRIEGQRLAQHILQLLGAIKEALAYVEHTQDQRLERIRQTTLKRIQDLQSDEHFQRESLEREVLSLLERLDISEEIARLTSHIQLFENTLPVPAKGKKLGFIAQEMGREINTIAAKSRDFAIQEQTIIMKDHLEQIKEQLANVL